MFFKISNLTPVNSHKCQYFWVDTKTITRPNCSFYELLATFSTRTLPFRQNHSNKIGFRNKDAPFPTKSFRQDRSDKILTCSKTCIWNPGTCRHKIVCLSSAQFGLVMNQKTVNRKKVNRSKISSKQKSVRESSIL